METYKPTPDDFKKAEDMMTPVQIEMTRKKEELMENKDELKKEVELKKESGEIVKTKNIREIVKLLNKGYLLADIDDELNLASVGINFAEINKTENPIMNYFGLKNLNENRNLLYLRDGFTGWMESVNNYWFNEEEYTKEENKIIQNGGLKAEILKNIKRGSSLVLHTDKKDFESYIMMLGFFLEKLEKVGINTKELKEGFNYFYNNIVLCISYKGSVHYGKENYPKELMPIDETKKVIHPLLKPFMDEIEKLESEGVTEIPDWLAEQSTMAGLSATFQETYKHLLVFAEKYNKLKQKYEKLIKEQDIIKPPKFPPLPKSFLERLEIVDNQIHRS